MQLEDYILPNRFDNLYIEKTFCGTKEDYINILKKTSTLYISNIEISIKEYKLWNLFKICGEVKRIIIGVNKITKNPCGFCFVEYYNSEDAKKALYFLSDFELEGKKITVDLDIGFKEGRQYGRGLKGGQLKSEYYSYKK